jgi:hypothetical protein
MGPMHRRKVLYKGHTYSAGFAERSGEYLLRLNDPERGRVYLAMSIGGLVLPWSAVRFGCLRPAEGGVCCLLVILAVRKLELGQVDQGVEKDDQRKGRVFHP